MITDASKSFAAIGLAAVIACASATPVQAEPDPGLTEEVANLIDLYLNALSERNQESLGALYVEDDRFVWLEEGRFQYQSADDVFASLAAFPPDMPIETQVSNLEVSRVGDNGVLASMKFSSQIGRGGESFEFAGVLTLVLEDSDDGWRIVGGHSSTARAMPEGQGSDPDSPTE